MQSYGAVQHDESYVYYDQQPQHDQLPHHRDEQQHFDHSFDSSFEYSEQDHHLLQQHFEQQGGDDGLFAPVGSTPPRPASPPGWPRDDERLLLSPLSRSKTITTSPSKEDMLLPSSFPTKAEFNVMVHSYLDSLSIRKRDKALISQEKYDSVLTILKDPRSAQTGTAQFRFWAKKMFELVSFEGDLVVTHEGRPVAVQEQIYDVLVYCHGQAAHGGRDKTAAMTRQFYSWVPKQLTAEFVKGCPLCIARRALHPNFFGEHNTPTVPLSSRRGGVVPLPPSGHPSISLRDARAGKPVPELKAALSSRRGSRAGGKKAAVSSDEDLEDDDDSFLFVMDDQPVRKKSRRAAASKDYAEGLAGDADSDVFRSPGSVEDDEYRPEPTIQTSSSNSRRRASRPSLTRQVHSDFGTSAPSASFDYRHSLPGSIPMGGDGYSTDSGRPNSSMSTLPDSPSIATPRFDASFHSFQDSQGRLMVDGQSQHQFRMSVPDLYCGDGRGDVFDEHRAEMSRRGSTGGLPNGFDPAYSEYHQQDLHTGYFPEEYGHPQEHEIQGALDARRHTVHHPAESNLRYEGEAYIPAGNSLEIHPTYSANALDILFGPPRSSSAPGGSGVYYHHEQQPLPNEHYHDQQHFQFDSSSAHSIFHNPNPFGSPSPTSASQRIHDHERQGSIGRANRPPPLAFDFSHNFLQHRGSVASDSPLESSGLVPPFLERRDSVQSSIGDALSPLGMSNDLPLVSAGLDGDFNSLRVHGGGPLSRRGSAVDFEYHQQVHPHSAAPTQQRFSFSVDAPPPPTSAGPYFPDFYQAAQHQIQDRDQHEHQHQHQEHYEVEGQARHPQQEQFRFTNVFEAAYPERQLSESPERPPSRRQGRSPSRPPHFEEQDPSSPRFSKAVQAPAEEQGNAVLEFAISREPSPPPADHQVSRLPQKKLLVPSLSLDCNDEQDEESFQAAVGGTLATA